MPQTIITRNPQKPLSIRSADEFLLKADFTQAIGQLSLLERGLLFAELSMYCYLSENQLSVIAEKAGFELSGTYSSPHGFACILRSAQDQVVVFRGTGERDWSELQADQKSFKIFADTIGKVHRCFKADVDEMWPKIERDLAEHQLPLWFCGHSIGGAFATISAQRCFLSYIRSEPEELHTFGSPRIGTKKYIQHVPLKHFRWVNNNDLITRVPSAWLGYRHGGTEMYLNREGKLESLRGWQRVRDRIQGAVATLCRGKLDYSEDHSIVQYVDRIYALVREEHPLAHKGTSNSKTN